MAVTAAIANGTAAGVLICWPGVRAVTGTDFDRLKDVGRTILKRQRDINASPRWFRVVAVTIGLGIRVWGGSEANTAALAWLLRRRWRGSPRSRVCPCARA